jgi:hypothetical protein
MASRAAERIGRIELTQGTETSKYLQERKSTETPLVVASESGIAQTEKLASQGCGRRKAVTKASSAESSGKWNHRG